VFAASGVRLGRTRHDGQGVGALLVPGGIERETERKGGGEGEERGEGGVVYLRRWRGCRAGRAGGL